MSDVPDDKAKARAALLGAVPITRMVDSGMEIGAALRLVAAVSAGDDFDAAAETEADELLAGAASLTIAARRAVRRAAIGALAVAQLAFNTDTDRKIELYAKLTSEVSALSAEWPDIYREVRVPFGDSALYGLLVRPGGVAAPETVILFGGLNGWGAAYLSVADALAEAGLACLLVELPGQGNTRLLAHLYADHKVVDAVSACVDWIRSTVDLGDRVGVWGNSFGGLFAALSAAADSRIDAACINGAPPIPSLPPFRTAQDLMLGFFGVDSPELVSEILPTIAFREATIACPVLVLHGGADPLVTEAEQRVFLESATASAIWREWPDGQHTMYNHAIERNSLVTSWFARLL